MMRMETDFCFSRMNLSRQGARIPTNAASRNVFRPAIKSRVVYPFEKTRVILSRIHAVDWLTQRRKDAKNKGVERIEIRSKNSPIGELQSGRRTCPTLCGFAPLREI